MSKKGKAKLGPYTVTHLDDNRMEVSFDLAQSTPPQHQYSADWCEVERRADNLRLLFGQALRGRLASLLCIRYPLDQLRIRMSQDETFLDSLFRLESDNGVSPWEPVEDPTPSDASKYLLEDANSVLMAYNGDRAEMSFYDISPGDLHRLQRRIDDARFYSGLQAKVTISLTTNQLRKFWEDVLIAVGAED